MFLNLIYILNKIKKIIIIIILYIVIDNKTLLAYDNNNYKEYTITISLKHNLNTDIKKDNNCILSQKTFYPDGKLKKIFEYYYNTNQIHFIRKYDKKGVMYEGAIYDLKGNLINQTTPFPDESLIQEVCLDINNNCISQVFEYTSLGKILKHTTYAYNSKNKSNKINQIKEYNEKEHLISEYFFDTNKNIVQNPISLYIKKKLNKIMLNFKH